MRRPGFEWFHRETALQERLLVFWEHARRQSGQATAGAAEWAAPHPILALGASVLITRHTAVVMACDPVATPSMLLAVSQRSPLETWLRLTFIDSRSLLMAVGAGAD